MTNEIVEPKVKRAIAFFDGQNLYRHAKDAFGHNHPNYDPIKLFDAICQQQGWKNKRIRFYTGTPSKEKSPEWHGYWSNRILAMKRAGIHAVSRPLRYRMKEITLSTGQSEKAEVAQEKGIDIRIALDIFKLTIENELDVAVIFSQDQDLAEVATEVKLIAKQQNRWVKISSAFPAGTNASCNYGIHGTDWIKIDQAMYDACLDARDYRPKISPSLSAASTPSTLATPAN